MYPLLIFCVSIFLINRIKYYHIINPFTDFEISEYELWKQIEVGKMYRLRYYGKAKPPLIGKDKVFPYYKHDESRIILQIEEFKYQDELNKYLINDLSNIIVEYYNDKTLYYQYNWYTR